MNDATASGGVVGTHADCGGEVRYWSNKREGYRVCAKCGMDSNHLWFKDNALQQPQCPELEVKP